MPDHSGDLGPRDVDMGPPRIRRERPGPLSRLFTRRQAPAMASRSYRYLARQIEVDLPAADGGQAIVISSPDPLTLSNEACLMFAHSLAAELGSRILVVDGTLGEDGVGSALGHAGVPGFLDVVYGVNYPMADLIQRTHHDGVSLLPTGRTGMVQLLPIEPARIVEFFKHARSHYDYVLLQQGPIFADSRYLQFASRSDMVLMLAEEGSTPVGVLDRCIEVLRGHQIANVRLVLSTPR